MCVYLCVQVFKFVQIRVRVCHCERIFACVSAAICAPGFPTGELCVTVQRYLTHQFGGPGRLQDL